MKTPKHKPHVNIGTIKSDNTETLANTLQQIKKLETPKEKADEMFNKFYFTKDKDGFHPMSKFTAKECTYIALSEIIDQWEHIDTYLADGNGELNPNLKYWYEVKKEVQKIPT